jgi:hypothetical protein
MKNSGTYTASPPLHLQETHVETGNRKEDAN